jgi:hypothetical protein
VILHEYVAIFILVQKIISIDFIHIFIAFREKLLQQAAAEKKKQQAAAAKKKKEEIFENR